MLPRHLELFRLENIKDGAHGITYDRLFGQYLEPAQWIRVVDPYLRTLPQIANLENFLSLVSRRCLTGASVEVITMYERDCQRWSRQQLINLQQQFAERRLTVTYRFDVTQHDRFIETDRHYIILGRGLDLFYPDSPFTPLPERRRARGCKVVYIPKNSPVLIEVG